MQQPLWNLQVSIIYTYMTARFYLYIRTLFLIILTSNISCKAKDECTHKEPNPKSLPQLTCLEDFKVLQGAPLAQKYSNVATVKVVYDFKSRKIFFVNSYYYKFHYEFCFAKFNDGYVNLDEFNKIEYSDKPERHYGLANLNYYSGSKRYTLELFADDKLSSNLLIEMFKNIQAKVFFKNNFMVFVNSETMASRKNALEQAKIPMIYPDEIFKGQTFQAMNKGIAYGYLKFVDSKKISKTDIKPNDIIVCEGLPNELPLCRGIVTSCFQTPLCHVNILSNNRGIPNAAWKNIFKDSTIGKLKNQLVSMEVKDNRIIIKSSPLAEAQKFWTQNKSKKRITLKYDLVTQNLIDATQLKSTDVQVVGGKASNFGELTRIKIDGTPLPIPEGAFAIPFYYYDKHIRTNEIKTLIDSLIADKNSMEDPAKLEKRLKVIRKKIKDSPLDPSLLALIRNKIKANGKWTSYRFRSSTNAEDIPGFNGAGLYSSKTGSLTDTSKPIDKAVRSVWASLWNLRAFQERAFFEIDQSKVFMGILCHRNFGDEEVNGVVVTKNLYRENYPGMVVNVQLGETSIVLPTDSISCEQLLITMPIDANESEENIGIDHIAFSSLSPSKNIMTQEEMVLLSKYCKAIKSHFYFNKNRFTNQLLYDRYGMDIEFKLEKRTRKLYIKQAREY